MGGREEMRAHTHTSAKPKLLLSAQSTLTGLSEFKILTLSNNYAQNYTQTLDML